jgi:alanyl aminopeptidase
MIRPRRLANWQGESCIRAPPRSQPTAPTAWLLTLLIASVFCPTSAQTRRVDSRAPLGRLSRLVIPLHYDVQWRIDPDAQHFSGSVGIDVSLAERTRTIWLHAKGLTVTDSRVLRHDRSIHGTFEQISGDGVARITFSEVIPAQELRLEIDYSGELNSHLQGLYRARYRDHNYVLSQFEPTSARLAMPCFDEPSFKTPFDIRVTIPVALRAISNSREVASDPFGNGMKTIRFAPTEPLPTYLLALAVGDLQFQSWSPIRLNDAFSSTPLRAVSIDADKSTLLSLLATTNELTTSLANYLGMPFPFSKLDIVVLRDLSGSGMENAGAVFYRDSDVSTSENSPLSKRRFSRVLQAHELAHQWFGDLVTPDWWNDLWLKEGFATFLSYRVADGSSGRDLFDRDYRVTTMAGMQLDSLTSTHAVRNRISTTGDIDSAYDAVSYNKSAALLGMLESYLGEKRFRDMLQQFLRDHAYGAASSEDFIQALVRAGDDVALGQSFRDFLDTPGIPEVLVDWNCATDGTTTIRLRQRRYLPLGSSGNRNVKWHLPICVALTAAGNSEAKCTLLNRQRGSLTVPGTVCKTIFPNFKGTGYYRWLVPPAKLETLLKGVSSLEFGEALSLADSVAAAFHRGAMGPAQYLRAANLLAASRFPQVAFAAVTDELFIRDFVEPAERRNEINAALEATYLRAAEEALTPDARWQPDQLAWRQSAARLLVLEVGTPTLRQHFASAGATMLHFGANDRVPDMWVPAEMRDLALASAVQVYGSKLIGHLERLLRETDQTSQRAEILEALAWALPENGLNDVVDLLTQSSISDSEAYLLLYALGRRAEARRPLLRFLLNQLPALIRRMPTDRQGQIPYMITGGYQAKREPFVRAGPCSADDGREFGRVFKAYIPNLSGGARYFANASEQISLCTKLADAQRQLAKAASVARSNESRPSDLGVLQERESATWTISR